MCLRSSVRKHYIGLRPEVNNKILLTPRKVCVTRTCNEWPLAYLPKHKTFKTMKKEVKKSHEAKTTFPCVDLKFEGNTTVIKPKQTRTGTLTYEQEDEKFLFKERGVPSIPQPHLHWRVLDRTLHGRVNVNARHIKVEFYIHHDEYLNGKDLADMLESEMETLGENLCDMNLEEEVAKCY